MIKVIYLYSPSVVIGVPFPQNKLNINIEDLIYEISLTTTEFDHNLVKIFDEEHQCYVVPQKEQQFSKEYFIRKSAQPHVLLEKPAKQILSSAKKISTKNSTNQGNKIKYNEKILEQLKNIDFILKKANDTNQNRIRKRSESIDGSSEEQPVNTNFDIVFLFAEPLVDSNQNFLSDFISYESEINDIVSSAKEIGVKIRIHFDAATLTNLRKVFSTWKPKILHIACHGYFSSKGPKLLFEEDINTKERKIGFSQEISLEDCDKILNSEKEFIKNDLQLVFINACHSEPFGGLFEKHHVRNVISIQSRYSISDEVAGTFAKFFYMDLFLKKNVPTAFNNSKTITDITYDFCCCIHPHQADCIVLKNMLSIEQKNSNLVDYHYSHTPLCGCTNKKKSLHDVECAWAKDFVMKYGNEKSKKYFDDNRMQEVIVCCCCPEDKYHKEAEKFILKSKPPGEDDPIFYNIQQGNLETNFSDNFDKVTKFNKRKTKGRQKIMLNIINSMYVRDRKQRIINICGESGSGRSRLCLNVGNYIYARRKKYNCDVYYLNLKGKRSFPLFKINLSNTLGMDDAVYESEIINFLRKSDKEWIIILDDCDEMKREHQNLFKRLLMEIISNCAPYGISIYFLITSHQKFTFFDSYCDIFIAEELSPNINNSMSYEKKKYLLNDAIQYFIQSVDEVNRGKKNKFSLPEHRIIEILSSIKRYPKILNDLATQLVSKGDSIHLLEGKHLLKSHVYQIELLIDAAQADFPFIAKLLTIIIIMNGGITYQFIEKLFHEDEKKYLCHFLDFFSSNFNETIETFSQLSKFFDKYDGDRNYILFLEKIELTDGNIIYYKILNEENLRNLKNFIINQTKYKKELVQYTKTLAYKLSKMIESAWDNGEVFESFVECSALHQVNEWSPKALFNAYYLENKISELIENDMSIFWKNKELKNDFVHSLFQSIFYDERVLSEIATFDKIELVSVSCELYIMFASLAKISFKISEAKALLWISKQQIQNATKIPKIPHDILIKLNTTIYKFDLMIVELLSLEKKRSSAILATKLNEEEIEELSSVFFENKVFNQ